MKIHLIAPFLLFLTINLFAQQSPINNNNDSIAFNPLGLAQKKAIEEALNLVKEKNKDALKIVSVTPINNLKHNETYTFTVAVVYHLTTNEEGILHIGHNSDAKPESYRLIEEKSEIVGKGSGYHIFNVTTKVQDLSSKGAAFYISTNLSEYPHSQKWSPLAGDRFLLKVN